MRKVEFDYAAFDPDTRRVLRECAEQIRGLARVTASGIMEIGKNLTEVKEQLRHGQFLKWIESEFGWSERKAENFMAVHARFKSANFAGLQIDISALYLIAAPSTPEPVRTEAIRRAEHGEHVSHRQVRALVQRAKGTGDLAEVAVGPPGTIAEQRPQTPRPRNKRQQKSDRAASDRLMECVAHLESFVMGLKDLDLEAAARTDGLDLAVAIRSIHKSRNLIEEWETALASLIPSEEPARKETPCQRSRVVVGRREFGATRYSLM
jgi:Protein of unknown function (DUF3102)